MRNQKCGSRVGLVVVALFAIAGFSGCATLDRAYRQEVTWTNAPVVGVVTNTVVVTRSVAGPGTNVVTEVVTNFVPMFYTNMVRVAVTNLVARPEALATIEATGAAINTFMPGVGGVVALLLGALYHGYRQVRNRKVNEALVQGVETARAVLTITPQGQAADAQFVKWLMDHQKETGVFATVSDLVGRVSDNPAARVAAQEIAQRVQDAKEQRTTTAAVAAAS